MKHAVHTVFKETVEAVTPVSNVSQFRDKGVLTPEEFVAAGDLLVFKCPSWTWEAGDPSKTRDYLPKDKQYLVTRNVPCHRRADGLASSVREMQMEDAEDGEWTETQAVGGAGGGGGGAAGGDVEDIDEDEDGAGAAGGAPGGAAPAAAAMEVDAAAPSAAGAGKDEEEDVPDLDDLEIEDDGGVLVVDPSALPAAPPVAAGANAEKQTDFVRARTYTVSITYDKYYQTPRMWLFGYDEDNKPLTHPQIFEDMSRDHAKKTVTIDPHPHIPSVSHASVHPCRHAAAMKRIIDQIESTGKTMRPDQALFLFLKFISSVIPTVEYDFTMDFDA